MRRLITLGTIALIVAARQVLHRGTEGISPSAEENKALARRWFEDLFNAGNLEVADEIIAPDHVNHDPTLPDIPPGPEGQKQVVNLFRNAFPNAHISIEDQLAEGDSVVTRGSGSGTHQGEFMGVAPTGNQVRVTGIIINRLSDGKIAESWTACDVLGVMRQIGAVPEPGQEAGS
jgi:predicted ester cyclase